MREIIKLSRVYSWIFCLIIITSHANASEKPFITEVNGAALFIEQHQGKTWPGFF